MSKKTRTSSIPAFEAFKHLFDNPSNETKDVDENADTIPEAPTVALNEIENLDDPELDTLSDSFDKLEPPKTTQVLRFIQSSTSHVLDSLLSEAQEQQVPNECKSFFLTAKDSGEIDKIEVDDDELSSLFDKENKKRRKEFKR